MPAASRSPRLLSWEKRCEDAGRASELDTSAQLGKGAAAAAPDAPETAAGNARERFAKRARAKYLSQALSLRLVDVEAVRVQDGGALPTRPRRGPQSREAARRYRAWAWWMPRPRLTPDELRCFVPFVSGPRHASGLVKAYWNTFHCSAVLTRQGDELTGRYCKNRWCTVCSRIRTAQHIERYLPTLESWEDKQFVTLTVPNVPAEELAATVVLMKLVWDRIREKLKKRYKAGQAATPLEGLRKLECTYNPRRNDYHPHFHAIVSNKETADEILADWLRHFPTCSRDAQDVRPADNNSVMELFKYFTKLVSGRTDDGGARYIFADSLNVIFNALSGQRVFQPYNMPAAAAVQVAEDAEGAAVAAELVEAERWVWSKEAADWVNPATGELLTGYVPGDGLRDLVTLRILTRPWRRPDPPNPAPAGQT